MQKLCCVRTRQQSSASLVYFLSPAYLTISPSILNHFWWELYHNRWLLCLIYVCYLLNHITCTALDGKIPLLALTGITPDISIILLFTFYQPVFYATYDQHFPSASEGRVGYWVGFGEHCGDAMTH